MEINPNSLLKHVFPNGHRWPEVLPSLVWNGMIVAGRDGSETLDRSQFPFLKVFGEAHPRLGLGTLARIQQWWAESPWTKSQQLEYLELLKLYYPRATHADEQLLKSLALTSEVFLNWVDEKELGLRELSFLNWSEFAKKQSPEFWQTFCNLKPSRAVGGQILEIYFEIAEFGMTPQSPGDGKPETWLASLQLQRYPNSKAQDLARQDALKSLAWPRAVSAQWVRSGDQTFAEIQMRIQNKNEFIEKLKSLEKIADSFQEIIR